VGPARHDRVRARRIAIVWAHELLSSIAGLPRPKLTPSKRSPRRRDHAGAKTRGAATHVARLERDFGSWKTPWGEINRFSGLSGAIDAGFDDTKPSLPVAFASGRMGLARGVCGDGPPQKTKRIYGNRGNSFVAVVEFGPRVKAKASSRRRERRSRFAAFQRPGRALQRRRSSRTCAIIAKTWSATPSGLTIRARSRERQRADRTTTRWRSRLHSCFRLQLC